MKIGCIGQGFVGKNMADDFEARGYEVVRYALEEEYVDNKDKIKECDVVFVAVPTPTTPDGSDASHVEEAVGLVGEGKSVVIKSTVVPGTTNRIQRSNPAVSVFFSPEFLSERTAAYDAANPFMNIVGVTKSSDDNSEKAKIILELLPDAPNEFIVSAEAAEIMKYAHNVNGYQRIVFANLLFDMATKLDADWSEIAPMMDADPALSPYYNTPVHKGGRGAGGNCFVKDMAAFRQRYAELLTSDEKGIALLKALEAKNLELLKATEKSQDLVEKTYGSNHSDSN